MSGGETNIPIPEGEVNLLVESKGQELSFLTRRLLSEYANGTLGKDDLLSRIQGEVGTALNEIDVTKRGLRPE